MHENKYIETALKGYDVLTTLEEAKYQRKKYFETYQGLPEWHQRTHMEARRKGYIETPTGRQRDLPNINHPNKFKRFGDERISVNTPVQSLGNDFMLLSFIEILGHAKHFNKKTVIDKRLFKPYGTVHDALLGQVREDYAYEAVTKIKSIMEDPLAMREVFNFELSVPLVADITLGKGWGIGKEIDFNYNVRKQVKQIVSKL